MNGPSMLEVPRIPLNSADDNARLEQKLEELKQQWLRERYTPEKGWLGEVPQQ
jgi:hypothetical protein